MDDSNAIAALTKILAEAQRSVPSLPTAEISADVAGMAASDDLTDSKIAAAEARSETKMARLEGKLDLVLQKLDDRKGDSASVKANLWVATGLVIAVIALITALTPAIFSIGTSVRDIIRDEVKQVQKP